MPGPATPSSTGDGVGDEGASAQQPYGLAFSMHKSKTVGSDTGKETSADRYAGRRCDRVNTTYSINTEELTIESRPAALGISPISGGS